MPSPHPIPTAIKRARGNPGKHRLNDAEPSPATTDASPPEGLEGAALAFWHRHAPELVRIGCLTLVDKDEFALGCLLRAQGLEGLKTGETLSLRRFALQQLEQSSRIFAIAGIGASNRSKITSARPKQPESRWAGLIGSKAVS